MGRGHVRLADKIAKVKHGAGPRVLLAYEPNILSHVVHGGIR